MFKRGIDLRNVEVGVSEKFGVPYFGVLIIRILLFRVSFFRKLPSECIRECIRDRLKLRKIRNPSTGARASNSEPEDLQNLNLQPLSSKLLLGRNLT